MKCNGRFLLALDLVFLILSLVGFAINLLLLARRFSEAAAGIAGCGGGACEEVLASRWAVIFGIPVTAFGLLVYTGLLLSLSDHARRLREPLLGMVTGAAAWFVFVQCVMLGKFCPWCMAAHGVAMGVVAIGLLRFGFSAIIQRVAIWAAASFLMIGLAQVYGPVPTTHRIEQLAAGSPQPAVPPSGQGRTVVFSDGWKTYDLALSPRLGRVDAKHVMVECFDYQCAACRGMSGFLDALMAKYPDDVAVLLLPVPLDGVCNRHVVQANQHPGSCDIARIALAVWKVKPEAFPSFHRALMADPSPVVARRLALERMAPVTLASALSDPWIEKAIQSNIADWQDFSKSTEKLPKLLIRNKRILHGLPSGEADFIRVMESELGLSPE